MRHWMKQGVALITVLSALVFLLAFRQHLSCFEKSSQVWTGNFHGHAQSSPENVIRFPFDDTASHSAPEVKLLIVGYMRSGSSFTGAIFDQNKDAMYVYEPLWVVQKLYRDQRSSLPMFWDKRDVDLSADREVERLQRSILTGYFNCRFKDVFLDSLVSKFQLISNKTFLLVRCLRQHPGLLGMLRCLPILQQTCRQAKAVVIKTIRYSMKDARKLMTADPQLKVLHLVRDPRATLQSQAKYGKFKGYGIKNYTRMFCDRLLEDLHTGDAIAQKFPDRLIRLRYEDLALHPLPYAHKLLKFAGLRMSPAQEKDFETLTSTDLKREYQQKFVKRTNSSVKASQWRGRIYPVLAAVADSSCGGVYALTGYLPLRTPEMLRNLDFPSMLPVSQVPRFLD